VSTPFYEQVIAQVVYGVVAGVLGPGLDLPSVREMVKRLPHR
jgi:DNA-binding transcriptional regulator YhcF (GntR family)